ncbi:MAG: YggU family protein [Chloroflexi bacterium]|nr:YggU family protein [Chloroflexota bacterium]
MVEEAQTIIVVRVQPNAGQNQVLGFKDGVLSLRIAAPPVKGKANQELIKFLSDILGVSKSNLTIEKGITAKRKVIAIRGLTQDQVMRSGLMK